MVSSDDLYSLGKAMSFLGKTGVGGAQIKRERSELVCLVFSSPTKPARCMSKEERWLRRYPSSMTKAKQGRSWSLQENDSAADLGIYLDKLGGEDQDRGIWIAKNNRLEVSIIWMYCCCGVSKEQGGMVGGQGMVFKTEM